MRGYPEEDNTPTDSITEAFTVIKLFVDTRRWASVPFYLCVGKRLGERITEIAVIFKRSAHVPSGNSNLSEPDQSALVIRVQPDEGLTLKLSARVPGASMQMCDVATDFACGHVFTEDSPGAYERLVLGAFVGSAPLFPHQREVETSWEILDPTLSFWETQGQPEPYAPGTWGPQLAHNMLARDGRFWRLP